MTCHVCRLSLPIQGCVFCKELSEGSNQIIMYRYDIPNKYDQAEFGAIIRVNKNDQRYDIYRNVSRDMQDPVWEYEGNFKE